MRVVGRAEGSLANIVFNGQIKQLEAVDGHLEQSERSIITQL